MRRDSSNDESLPPLTTGARIKVKPGTVMPEFPSLPIGGWTGVVTRVVRRKHETGYLIAWDGPIIDRMPRDYVRQCGEHYLMHQMAYLQQADVEAAAHGASTEMEI